MYDGTVFIPQLTGQVTFNHGDIIRFPSNKEIAEKHKKQLLKIKSKIENGELTSKEQILKEIDNQLVKV